MIEEQEQFIVDGSAFVNLKRVYRLTCFASLPTNLSIRPLSRSLFLLKYELSDPLNYPTAFLYQSTADSLLRRTHFSSLDFERFYKSYIFFFFMENVEQPCLRVT